MRDLTDYFTPSVKKLQVKNSVNTTLSEEESNCIKETTNEVIGDKTVDVNPEREEIKNLDLQTEKSEDLVNKDVSLEISGEHKTEECDNKTAKLNAFQLMMESRNKSIGQNSPGKELSEDEKIPQSSEYKEKLSVVKNLLQDWAEKKGASKRKRDEEDKEKIINHKLKKRARRLKRLLKVDEPVKVIEDSAEPIVKKRRVNVIDSSSDSSKEVIEFTKNEINILRNPILEVEENAQDCLLNSSNSKDATRGSLNFFGVLSTPKTEDENNSCMKSNTVKVKMFNSKERKLKSRLCLRKEQKRQTEPVIITDAESSELTDNVKLTRQRKDHKASNKKSKTSIKRNKIESEKADGITPYSLKISTKKNQRKSKRNNNLKGSDERLLEDFESKALLKINKIRKENVDSLTPGSSKTWKLKIKFNDEDTVNQKEETGEKKLRKTKQKSVNYREYITDESSSGEEIILSNSEEDSKETEKKKVKVAPVFIKATPRPKVAPEILEAKKQFLMSGIPSSLKKTMERQQSAEEREFDIFPSISHVQQQCQSPFWNLPKSDLNLNEFSSFKSNIPNLHSGFTNSHISTQLDIQMEVKKVDKLKTLLNKIKSDNPNYPVYKSFRLIYEKSGKMLQGVQEKKPKHKRKKKNADDSTEIIDLASDEGDMMEHAMWTEKYKPRCSDDIIGNADALKNIKKWLESWLKFSQEINAKKKRRRNDSTSDSEFDNTDCDSRDSTKLPGNTLVLGGPCGSGKTTAIYAICKELGFNVIELNASSKRTGKRLIQELQEATQSHQIGQRAYRFKRETKNVRTLIEDIDIVFEQDDGFISGLTQLITTSKRPIIMTTTDASSVYAQKFICQYEYISFLPLSSQTLATWLQIVCLVEGLYVNCDDIGCLLEFNQGDARKTLQQLQFWVQSGGQIVRNRIAVKIYGKHSSAVDKMLDDEQLLSCVKDKSNKKDDTFIHSNCIASFEILRDHKPYSIPYYISLGLLWWNIPNILNIPNFSSDRLYRFRENKTNVETKYLKEDKYTDNEVIKKLQSIERFYDSLALTDVMFRKVDYFDGTEPNVKNHNRDVKDSLELRECMDGYDGYLDFVHEVTHTLVNGCIEQFNVMEGQSATLNMAIPGRTERRWRAKHHVCEDVFQDALSPSCYVERKAVALDYMSSLRNISRSEMHRAANNTKRGKRFRNYLRDLNVNHNDSTLKLACNILTVGEEL
ncbi:hypothetical protein NQ318_022719 [Aromia moschata]|uniref:ATPase AAA-type core domain-containing protein n=1 Tax=Aromia moschata TaxID=1265417 RepID=A0AAV8YCR6_9CUCU|nr:hypothetical protein NQ318_022719 [Aromia moschata]